MIHVNHHKKKREENLEYIKYTVYVYTVDIPKLHALGYWPDVFIVLSLHGYIFVMHRLYHWKLPLGTPQNLTNILGRLF